MKKMKLLSVLCCIFCACTTVAACDSFSRDSSQSIESSSQETAAVSIEIATYDGDANVAVGATKQLKTEVENGKSSDASYEIVSGSATVSASGLVTVNTDAAVGEKIEVIAKIGDVSSNTLQLTVVDLAATAMTLTPSANVIAKGVSVTFTATFTPEYATAVDYTLSIDGDCDFAEIDAETKTLTIKADALPEEIDGKQIAVKATLTANNAVSAYAFVTVREEAAVSFLACETVNFVVSKDSNKSIVTEAYNWDGDDMDVETTDLTYTVDNEEIITVDAAGKITPKGHGTANVTVAYGDVTTTCVVNVMITPEYINFEGLNAHMSGVGELYYAKGDANGLDLGVSSVTKTGYASSSEKVTYKFENLDDAQATDIATVGENGIIFKQTGKIKVTVMSDSSLADYEVNEAYEVKKSVIVNVNDGVNIYSVADLKEYAKDENANKTANIMADISVDDTNNFGNEYNKYLGLDLRGNRTIQGNGYTITTQKLSRGESADTGKYSFLHFMPLGNAPFSVGVYDWTIQGNVNIKGEHTDGTSIVEGNSTKIKNNYYRAIEISGAELAAYDAGNTSMILESAIVKNVTVKGFYTAVRYEHAISAVAEKVTIGDCFANGIENCQSHLLVKDVEIQQVGAFGIEITPDDVRNMKTNAPSGSAGRQYNETATVRYEGYMKSNNFNNGESTVYMQNLKNELGISIGSLVQMATMGLIQKMSDDQAVQQALLGLALQTIMNEKYELNFSTLVFTNPLEFTQYNDKGNTENKFCEFETTEKINVKKLFENCMANPNYDYTEKKYLILDLADLDLGLGKLVNLGQVILVNRAYKG